MNVKIKIATALFAFSVFGAVFAKGADKPAEPDFAFPDKVAADADVRLSRALDKGDGPEVVNSLVCYSLARNAVSPSLLPPVIQRIDSVAAAENDACVKSLLYLLEAHIYYGLYSRDKWRYDERQIPADSLSADYTEWSGEQFKRHISGLLSQAVEPVDALAASPLSDWSSIILSNEYTFIFYPTLYDLVAGSAIDTYSRLSDSRAILPFRFLSPTLVMQPITHYARVDSYSRRAHELSMKLVKLHKGHPAPEVMARIRNIQTMRPLVNYTDGRLEATNSAYMALYRDFAATEWGAEALIASTGYVNREYVAALRAALERFPNYFRADALRSRLADIERPSVMFSRSGLVTPGKPFDMTLTFSNTGTARILFYRDSGMTENEDNSLKITDKIRSAAVVREFSIPMRELPFSCDTVVSITLDKPGRYYVWAEIEGTKTDYSNGRLLCTDLASVTLALDGQLYPYAVNSFTGKPIQGLKLEGVATGSKKRTDIATTDTDGTVKPLPRDGYRRLFFTGGSQSVEVSTPWSYRTGIDTEWDLMASFFTSLPLYHHGDSVEWALVAFETRNGQNRVAADRSLKVCIQDANGTAVDSATVVTDASGRATGVTRLPAEGLSGRFTAEISSSDDDEYCGRGSFMVNDYKLPTFRVEVTGITRSAQPDSAVAITAKAETYSMFPLAGAKVSAELAGMSRYWWGNNESAAFWSTDSVTGSDGTFRLVIPREVLELSPVSSDRYMVRFNVTSPGGETQSCSRLFTTGKPYMLINVTGSVVELKAPFDLGVRALDAMGKDCTIPVRYKIYDADSVKVADVAQGEVPDVAPGVYRVVVEPADTALASPITVDDVVFYTRKGKSPFSSGLFVPVKSYTATTGKVDVVYGTGNDACVLAAISVDGRMVSRRWITCGSGMHSLEVDVPDTCRVVNVTLTSLTDNESKTSEVSISNELTRRTLDVSVESFRDKVVPGTPEQITLSVRTDSIPSAASLIMLMESRSILGLSSHSMSLNVPVRSFPMIRVGATSDYLSVSAWNNSNEHFSWPDIKAPAFNLYGYTFSSSYNRNLLMRKMTASGLFGARAVPEAASADMNVVRESSAVGSVEEVAADYATDAGADGAVVEEESADAGDDTAAADTFQYRPSEVPLAFFAPMLSVGDDGRLTYTYTVPDANTEWVLRALAYTPDMLSGSLERTVTASRPVMVQSTLPRFMRYGDEASLRAMVMNATDSAQVIATTVTLLNAADMSVLAVVTQTDTVAARGNVTVSIPFTAQATGQAVIYRVKALAGNYSDGEQDVIPLLPASQPVIVSHPFYVAPDSASFTMTIPAAGKDNCSTLYLYDNPVWEVVTALPSLRENAAVTSVGAMNDIYMAAVARGIMAKNPALKRALREWLESDRSDETLTSMLTRNDDLKQLSLNATPWMRDAMTDNERLSSLALLLDDRNISKTIDNGIATLGRMAMADGGLAWCKGFGHSSLWATYRVLTLIAGLQERGYMPDNADLRKITARAVDYIDNDIAETIRRNGSKGDYTQYSYIRSILQGTRPSPASRQAITITINNILKRWSGESPQSKGIDAVILYRNRYPSMARRLVASIKAYSMSSPEKGTWWEGLGVNPAANLLYTIETVTPDDRQLIGSVAQWLIFSKTNQSWQTPACTSAAIDALLGAIDVEKAVNGTAEVTLNGRKVGNDTPQFPGMTVADISQDIASADATLTITKNTGLQAMGSVISRSIVAMDSIPAVSHPSVSIAKRFNVVRGTVVEGADTLHVGDRVRVQLVINVKDDLDYLTIVGRSAACLEPVEQLSGYTQKDGLWFYREVTDSETRMFIGSVRRGTYVVDTEMTVVSEGRFTSGVATLQSQINPSVAANSSARSLVVVP